MHSLCSVKIQGLTRCKLAVGHGKLLFKPASNLPGGRCCAFRVIPTIRNGNVYVKALQLHHGCLRDVADHRQSDKNPTVANQCHGWLKNFLRVEMSD